ncbi:hypothetical protein F5879DRAFT_1019992 [Lentinula edodes]|nr:hypothetical protein GG344DRAFT_82780 [Lentinula edodes]KAJ3908793.1 hypothetical protein F5879DRAFT_1019992 [Lentinula edodes]KAJ3910943.1 hypothetical protein F5877DRAFT_86728 [Lentinula edodes]
MAPPVAVRWVCYKPGDKDSQSLCESIMIKIAMDHGLDSAVVRKGPHTSYSTNGSINHITGDILDNLSQSGFSLHFYLSEENEPLPDTPELPNPQLWPVNCKSCPKKRRKRNRKNKKKTA